MIENLSVSSWEELSAAADEEHQSNLATLNRLQRQRAQLSVVALLSHDPNATNEIDQEIAALERRMTGHLATRQLLSSGLEAARMAEQAAHDLDRAAVLKIEAQRRAELATAVDRALSELATTLTEWLNSTETASRPERACGNLRRAFTYHFVATGFRNKPGWWRQAIVGMSEPGISLPTAVPLAYTVDPAVAEAAALEQAATVARTEALERLKSLTLPTTLPAVKTRQKRPVAAEMEAA